MKDDKDRRLAIGSIGWWGSALGIALGLGLLGLSLSSIFRAQPLPIPLTIALFIAGGLQAALCWLTIRRVRVAWAFATALGGTAGIVFLFSAPKIRDELAAWLEVAPGAALGLALVPCVLGAAVATLLALAATEIS